MESLHLAFGRRVPVLDRGPDRATELRDGLDFVEFNFVPTPSIL